MHFFEEYLDLVEDLPQELRDGFAELRDLDLAVQNNTESLETRKRKFFEQYERGELKNEAADAEYENILQDYSKISEVAKEKVALATQMNASVKRYFDRLDSDLLKAKSELEADKKGITENLEKRSLELDVASSSKTVNPKDERTGNKEPKKRPDTTL